MFKKKHMVVALGIVSVFLGGFFFSNALLAQGSGEYDPWLDYNEDGIVDVNDLHPLGQAYGSSGDPTKNVNVTNWPVSTDTAVWYDVYLGAWTNLMSGWYEADGFGQLHLLVRTLGATGDVYLDFYGLIPPDFAVCFKSIVFGTANYSFAITMPVPSEKFMFRVHTPGTTVDSLYFGFYLTW
jgi:hypothetical protein